MKVQLFGVKLSIEGNRAGKVTLKDLFAHIASKRDEILDYRKQQRLIYIDESGDYYIGLLLTIKDVKRFCQLKRERNGIQIDVREIGADNDLVDFNFFVLEKDLGWGIYSHYRGAWWPLGFGNFCRNMLDEYCRIETKKEIEASKNEIDEKKKKAIKTRYAGALDCRLVLREESFDDLINKLSSIESFDIAMTATGVNEEPWFRNLRKVAKAVRRRVSFARKSSTSERRAAIKTTLSTLSEDFSEAVVVGAFEDGIKRSFSTAENNPETYEVFDYDEVAAGMNINPEEFAKCDFISTMKSLTQQIVKQQQR